MQPDANGNQRFRNLLVDPKFVGLYEETKRATTSLDDEIDDRAFLVASHGYTKLRIPDNKAEPYLVPLANPLELFAEILRRSSASKLYEGLVASDLLGMFCNGHSGFSLLTSVQILSIEPQEASWVSSSWIPLNYLRTFLSYKASVQIGPFHQQELPRDAPES